MRNDQESADLEQARASERDARFRRALERALLHPDGRTAVEAVVGAMGTLIDDHEGAVAFEMAEAGLHAFISRQAHDRRAARTWHAVSTGCDPNQPPIDIIDLARAVRRTALLFRASPECISPAGAAAVMAFRAQYLVGHLRTSIPSEALLLELFSKHNEPHSNGGLTTVGIVARIMHDGRLFGESGKDLSKTRKRVDRVFARAGIPTE